MRKKTRNIGKYLLHPAVFGEQFNLQFASGDYSDIYCEAAANYNGGYDKAVEDEVLLELTDLLEEYAPNYNAIKQASLDRYYQRGEE